MESNLFEADYDVGAVHIVRPVDQQFQMRVTPRFRGRYENAPYEAYTARLLSKMCQRASVFIDVGAHYGFFSLLVASRYPHLRVIALEPVRENFQILEHNIADNGVENIEAHNLAVSNAAEEKLLYISEASDNCGFYPHPSTCVLRRERVRNNHGRRALVVLPGSPSRFEDRYGGS